MMTGLIELINQYKKDGMIVCEVGCNDGCTTKVYAPIIKAVGGKIHVVDWFRGNEQAPSDHIHGWRPNDLDVEKLINTFKANLDEVGCLDIVTIHQGCSWEKSVDFADLSLDLCCIDADHRYSVVIKDIDSYLPKVKNGGILCGHDFEGFQLLSRVTEENKEWQCWGGVGHMGVIQAVADRFPQDRITRYSDTVWSYTKD